MWIHRSSIVLVASIAFAGCSSGDAAPEPEAPARCIDPISVKGPPSGEPVWAKALADGPAKVDVAVAGGDTIYAQVRIFNATRYGSLPLPPGADWVLAKLDGEARPKWVKPVVVGPSYTALAIAGDAVAMTMWSDKTVNIAGTELAGTRQMVVALVGDEGVRWTHTFQSDETALMNVAGTPGGDVVFAFASRSVAVDGKPIACGNQIVRYDPKGAVRWSRCINATAGSYPVPAQMKVDASGNTWLTTYIDSAFDAGDGEVLDASLGGALLELDPAGKTIRKMTAQGAYPAGFALFDDGSMFLTGDLSKINEPRLFGKRWLRCDDEHANFVMGLAPDGSTSWIRSEALVLFGIVAQTTGRAMVVGGRHAMPLVSGGPALDGFFATIDSHGDVIDMVPVTDMSMYQTPWLALAGSLSGGDVIAWGKPTDVYRIGSTTAGIADKSTDLLIRLH